jgi:hypothetical protein
MKGHDSSSLEEGSAIRITTRSEPSATGRPDRDPLATLDLASSFTQVLWRPAVVLSNLLPEDF